MAHFWIWHRKPYRRDLKENENLISSTWIRYHYYMIIQRQIFGAHLMHTFLHTKSQLKLWHEVIIPTPYFRPNNHQFHTHNHPYVNCKEWVIVPHCLRECVVRSITCLTLPYKLLWLLSGVVVYLCIKTHFPLPCVCVFVSQKKKKKLDLITC